MRAVGGGVRKCSSCVTVERGMNECESRFISHFLQEQLSIGYKEGIGSMQCNIFLLELW